jgi:hypothetical protein
MMRERKYKFHRMECQGTIRAGLVLVCRGAGVVLGPRVPQTTGRPQASLRHRYLPDAPAPAGSLRPALDVVVTVCDHAKESCPLFSGNTLRLHWPFEDPALIEGTEEQRKYAFRKTRDRIRGRIMVFLGEGRA